MRFKRMLSIFLAIVLLLAIIPSIPMNEIHVFAGNYTLQQLKDMYPDGAYWNHSLYGANNPGGYTWTACECHGRDTCGSAYDCTCNGYTYNGAQKAWQCMGFAYQLAQLIYGGNPYVWSSNYDYTSAMANLKAGDVIRYYIGSNSHSVFVTSVNGDAIKVGECNRYGKCQISWGRTIYKSDLESVFKYVDHAPYEWTDGGTSQSRKSTIKMFTSHYGSDYLTAMNNSVTSGYAQDTIYFWYVISDDYTGDLYNSYTDYTYTVNLTLYYSDGTYKNFTYNSSDNNWLRLTPQRSGLYKMELQLSGEVDSDVLSTSYTVSYNAGLSASRSSVSLNLNGTNTSTITFTPTGGYPGSRGVKYNWDSSIIEKVSGSWSNGVYSLSIKGLKCGSTTIVMQLYENYTDSETVVASVSIPVTVTANTTTLSVNTSYNASISSAGISRYYKYVPSTSGKYVIYSTSGADPKVYLLNSNYGEITSDDDDGEGSDFRLEYNLTAGTTYYYQVQYYSSSAIGTIPFTFGRVYTITYNANGGSGAPSSQSKDYAANITLSSTEPTRQGYTFLGWSTSSSASSASYQPGRTFSTNANTTLYAVWRRDVYTLSLNSSYSPSISAGEVRYYTFTPSSTGTYVIYSNSDYDTKVSLLNASDVEITSDDDGGEGTDFRLAYTLTAGTKYYFAVKFYSSSQSGSLPFIFGRVYTITYNANGGSGAPSSQSKDYAANITLSSTEPTRQGYTFLGWSTSSSASSASYQPGRTFSTNANTTLYAVWRKSALLGDVNGDGLINPFDASLILRLDAMLISADSINLVAADVSGDGKVNALDASLILRYDAMLISTFPAER